ncbi:YceD family protein [Lysobacter sp. A6]|uniref:Large ribosomal RNA subunit accumulation protein YceD n=1 Tax=Noviluteimonas lactosilytica TaxID=2888523 RepID=A0ABS8JEN5_9GAMM|nr:YceD family protein [Lysobacter lactosilyticus]MCC8362048.1 YceD family protein [Lysobacter lactosilyticus]
MSADSSAGRLPEQLDAWRMVATQRTFEGVLPLSDMPRLRGALVDTDGSARVYVEFGEDALRVPFVELRIDAKLPLECQRSLQRFAYPVKIVQRLGLIRDEEGENALPEGYEALLVGNDGLLRPAELVEDELILAVPVVPVAPGTEAVERDWTATEEELQRASPFSALSSLKGKPES